MDMMESNITKSRNFLRYTSVICKICDNDVELKNFVSHLTIHTGVSDCLFCIECELKFTLPEMFYKHMKSHAVRIDCQLCPMVCYSKHHLYHHVENVHGNIEMLKIDKPKFEAHLDDLQKAYKAVLKARAKRRGELRKYQQEACKICGKTLQKRHLRSHMKTHTRVKPTTCDVCGRKCSSSSGMMCHKSVVHGARSLLHHKCKECVQFYTGPYEKHVEEVHKKEGFTLDNIPTCEWCGMRFATRQGLKRHLWIHTNEKIACEICDKMLRPKAINKHIRTVHGAKRKKEMAQCGVCDKVLSKSYLSLHMTFHSNKKFQCEDCGKCFPLKGNLDTHRTSHTERRPYSCDLCEKTFKLPHHMRAHRKTHKDA